MADGKTSSRIFLLSSLALGVLAMAAAFLFLQNSANQEQGPKVKILVAKHDLRENAVLDPSQDFEELDIPQRFTFLQALALSPASASTYKSQRLNRGVLAGQPLMLADLGAGGNLELHGDGRAMSVLVKGSNALSGLVMPGDLVKLMVTRATPAPRLSLAPPATAPTTSPAEPPASHAPYESTLVAPTAFRVMAVNQRLARTRSPVTASDAYQSAGDANSNLTVTLEVTEAQAKTILEQTGAGQVPVTLLLCPPSPAAAGTGTTSR